MNICALSTARGGAIAVIRVSGPDAINIVDQCFVPVTAHGYLTLAKGQTVHYGELVQNKDGDAPTIIDDVLVTVFRAPHSYTGENSAEISCHASTFIISSILQALIAHGCRQALPGEYTKRAYLNGKMDLSQAEAVADIIACTNTATHRMAMSQLRGNFSSELARLSNDLLHLTSLIELELDFSDHEDLEFADRTDLASLTSNIVDRVQHLATSFKTGQALKQGVPVVIAGKTNVGKSTLLNRLLHEEKAIVCDIHGTTRDVIEDVINIRGIDFRIIDTAGLRTTDDAIERIGIERTRLKLAETTIVLWVTTPDIPFDVADLGADFSFADKKVIKVINKIDLCPTHATTAADTLMISAKEGIGIEALEEALVQAADIPEISENDIIVTSTRHYEALTKAFESLHHVKDGLRRQAPTDLLAEDLRSCINALNEITGKSICTDTILSNIFQNFCVGK